MLARCENPAQADQMMGNCNTMISLRVADETTTDTILKLIPGTKVSRQTASVTNNVITRGVTEADYKLIPSQIFNQMPNFEYVVKQSDGTFYKGKLPRLVT